MGVIKGVVGVSGHLPSSMCWLPALPQKWWLQRGHQGRAGAHGSVPLHCHQLTWGHCWWFLMSCLHWSSHHCWCCNVSDCGCAPGKSKVIIGKASRATVWVKCAWGRVWFLGDDAGAIDSMSESMPATLVLSAAGLLLGFSSSLSEVCG